LKEARNTIVGGLALAVVKLALLPLHPSLTVAAISSLTDTGLALIMVFAAWRASLRSLTFARLLWSCVALASVLWTLSTVMAALNALRSNSFAEALSRYWPTTIIFFLAGALLAAPLLAREETGKTEIDWLRALGLAQLAILTFAAYLVFFYIPVVTSHSIAMQSRSFMIAHFTRGGFLAIAYFYRGWRSRYRDLRALQLRLSAFFVGLAAAGGLWVYAVNDLHLRVPLVDCLSDLPSLFLIVLAVLWKQEAAFSLVDSAPQPKNEMVWAQLLPAIMPLSVIALAARVSPQYQRVAWITVAFSVACYAASLMVMQYRQNLSLAKATSLEEKFFRVFRSSPAAISITRLSDGKFIDVNDRWLEIIQLKREEVIGRTSLELGTWETPGDRKSFVDALQKQGSVRNMPMQFRMAGKRIVALLSGEMIELGGEKLVIGSFLDVTEIQNLTQQLRQAQKMELIGSLAGGVAHDFNNLLTIIKGYSELAHERASGGEFGEDLQQVIEAAGRAASLTRQLLAFSRRQVLQPRNISLNSVVEGVEKLLRRTLGENIELVLTLSPDLGTTHVDPVQMEQVVINLAINARDAMPKGGKLLFETKNLDLSAPYSERNFEVPPGHYVLLSVSDTGVGMAAELIDRIFEPFFTTKEIGRGTGLGLSTVYGIVKQSGGYVWAYSEPGIGSTFKLCLPRVAEPAEELAGSRKKTDEVKGTETILVVEDDPHVRELTVKVLRQHGYKVLDANSGEEALAQADEFNGEIHLLLTDVIMAGTSGAELAERMKNKRPEIKLLYMSGYPHASGHGAKAAAIAETFLSKPFSPSELARKVRETLSQA
jgi:PAS domain S-box-containing protein